MYDTLLLEEDQTGQDLSCKASDQRKVESGEAVCTNQFVEIDRQAWRDDAEVRSEVERACDRECRVRAIWILSESQCRSKKSRRNHKTYPFS